MQSVNLLWLSIYIALSMASISFVRFAGPRAIGVTYRIEESYDDDDSGKINVAYRILSPTICCELPVFMLAVACDVMSISGPTLRYLPTLFYWVILGAKKHAKHALQDRLAPFLGEATISLLLSIAFDYFVIEGYFGDQGINVLDNSSIAFQFELALFGVATCWISTFFTRTGIKKSLNYSKSLSAQQGYCYSPVDTSEAKLFSYERDFGNLLPHRFSSDILLRSVFFTIMAIEDGNRPKFIRSVERMAARVNLAKTTGIMQQTSDKPLSDIDSVEMAIPFVERMWNRYLEEFARSTGDIDGEALRIYSKYYTYDYSILSQSVCEHFGPFYGDYCGTRLLNASRIFREVLKFEERQRYCLLPKKITAPGSICAREFEWLSGDSCFWIDHETIVSFLVKNTGDTVRLVNNHGVREGLLTKIAAKLKELGITILSVKFIEGVAAELVCRGDESVICEALGEEWEISD